MGVIDALLVVDHRGSGNGAIAVVEAANHAEQVAIIRTGGPPYTKKVFCIAGA